MSGGEHWASVEPSTNCTIECTIDCGCTTTSIRSRSTPYSRCASSSSSPLLTRVAQLVVITRPMSQVGWASACSGRDVPHLLAGAPAERTAARGQHQPVDLCGGAAAQALRERGVLGVDRHDLSRLARAPVTSAAADHQGLLVGQREDRRRPSAARVGRSPAEPVMPLSTTSQGRPTRSVGGVGTHQHAREVGPRPAQPRWFASAWRAASRASNASSSVTADRRHVEVEGLPGQQLDLAAARRPARPR